MFRLDSPTVDHSRIALAPGAIYTRIETPLAAPRREPLEVLVADNPLPRFDEAAARADGAMISRIRWSRSREFARLTAAQALCGAPVVVSRDLANVRDISGLTLESWGEERT